MPLGEAAANGPLGRWPEFLSGSVSNFIEQRAVYGPAGVQKRF